MAASPSQTDERFQILDHAKRVWAIGAIDAEAERLKRLHDQLEDRFEPGDRLIDLGNAIGVGAAAIATLDELVRFRRRLLALLSPYLEAADIIYLRGAQEEMWIKLQQLQFAIEPAQTLAWMLQHGVEPTVRAYGLSPDDGAIRAREGVMALSKWTTSLRDAIRAQPGHAMLLSSLKRAAYTEGHELLFVNAGIDPGRPLTEQRDTFWWGSGYFHRVTRQYGDFRRVIRGFDREHGGVVETDFTTTLDGGSGYDGRLVGACFDLSGHTLDRIEG